MQNNNEQQLNVVSDDASLENTSETRVVSAPVINTGALPVVPNQPANTPYSDPVLAQGQNYSLKVYKSNSKLKSYIVVGVLLLLIGAAGAFIILSNKNDRKQSYPSQPLQQQLNNQASNNSEIDTLTLSVGTNLIVKGTSNLQGDVAFDGNLNVVQNLTVQGKTQLNSLEVNGIANINGELRVNGQLIPQGLLNLLSGDTIINNNVFNTITGGGAGSNNGQLSGDGANITGIKATNCADCVRLQGSTVTEQIGNIAIAGNINARKTNLRAGINAADTFTVETATGEKIITADTLNRNVIVENLRPNTSGSAAGGTYTHEYDQYNGQINVVVAGTTIGDTSSVLANDDRVRIVYNNYDTSDIVFVRCIDIACTNNVTQIVGNDPINWTSSPKITLDANGLPIIVYVNDTTYDINVVHCDTADCSSFSTQVIAGDPSAQPRIDLDTGPDGFARILVNENIYDFINDSNLHRADLIRCTNATCSTYVETEVTNVSDDLYIDEAVYTTAGNLKFTAYDTSNLLLMTCQDADCNSYISTTIGNYDASGLFIDTNDIPKIIIDNNDYITGDRSLRLITCSNTLCSSTTIVDVYEQTASGNEDVYLTAHGMYSFNGQSIVAYTVEVYNYDTGISTSVLRFATCVDSMCSSLVDRPAAIGNEGNPYELLDGPGGMIAGVYSLYDANSGTQSLLLKTNMTPSTFFAAVTVPAQSITGTTIGDASNRFGQIYGQNVNIQTATNDTALFVNKLGITGELSDGSFMNQITGNLVDFQMNGTSVFKIDNLGALSVADPSTENTIFEVQSGSLMFKDGDNTNLFAVTNQASTFNTPLIVSPASGNTSDKFIVGDANAANFKVNNTGGVVIGQTFSDASNFYEVVNDTFAPSTLTSNATTITGLTDDSISSEIPVPFTINFFNKKYNSLKIMSDGAIGFDAQYACFPRYTPQYARDYGCRAVVMGVASDLNPDAGGTIRYEVLGEAPNRVFVAEFMNVKELGVPNGNVSFQIQIYESENPNVGNKITVQTIDASMEARTYGQGLVSPNATYLTYIDSRINLQPTFNLTNDAISYVPSAKFNTLNSGSVSIEDNLKVQNTISADQAVVNNITAPSVRTNKSGTFTEGLNVAWYNSDAANYKTLGSGTLVDQSIETDPFLLNIYPYSSGWPSGLNTEYTNTSWTGWFKATKSAESTFQVCGYGGYRLYIDGKPVVNKWSDGGSRCSEGKIYLEESTWYPIQVDYYHGTESNPGIDVKMSTNAEEGVRFLNHNHGTGSSNLDRLVSATQPSGLISSGTYLKVSGDVGFDGKLQDSNTTGSYLSFSQAAENSGAVLISTRSASNVGLAVQGSASQTGDLLQLKDSTGAVLTKFDNMGNISSGGLALLPSTDNTSVLQIQNAAASTTILSVDTVNLRVEVGEGSDIHMAGIGNARNAITKTYNCSIFETVNSVVVINGAASVGQTTAPDSNRVAGVVVARPTTSTCTIAIGGSAQVNFGSNPGPVSIGDPVTTSSVSGAAQSNATPPAGSILGNSTSAKDGSNLVWVLIRGN